MFEPHSVVERLASLDVDDLDRSGTQAGLVDVSRVESWLAARKTQLLSRMRSFTADTASALTAASGVDTRTSARHVRSAATLITLPGTLAALEAGEISPSHAEAMTKAVANNPALAGAIREHESALLAPGGTVVELAARLHSFVADNDRDPNAKALRQRQRRTGSFWVGDHDMRCARFELTPDDGEELQAAVVHEARRLWRNDHKSDHDPGDTLMIARHGQYLADALMSLVRSATNGTAGDATLPRRGATVVAVHHLGDTHPHYAGSTPMPPATFDRLACEAGLTHAIADASGAVLHLQRRARVASDDQRLALQIMYPRGCALCGADWAWCHIHHIVPWEHGGATNLDNLMPACSLRCHHLLHEGGWTAINESLGHISIWTPDGRLHKQLTAHSPPPTK